MVLPDEEFEETIRYVWSQWSSELRGRGMREEDTIGSFLEVVSPVVVAFPMDAELEDRVDVQVRYVICLLRPEWRTSAEGVRSDGGYHTYLGFAESLRLRGRPARAEWYDASSYTSMESDSMNRGEEVTSEGRDMMDAESNPVEDPSEEEDPSEDEDPIEEEFEEDPGEDEDPEEDPSEGVDPYATEDSD